MKRELFRFLAIVVLLFSVTEIVYCAESSSFLLTGRIVSFDEKSVKILSGKKTFQFQKSELKFPSYKVGDQIQIELTQAELDRKMIRAKK
jgi:hypothetical protein